MPKNALPTLHTLAAPPGDFPAAIIETFMKVSAALVASRKQPNSMKIVIRLADRPVTVPQMPSVLRYRCSIRNEGEIGGCPQFPDRESPNSV